MADNAKPKRKTGRKYTGEKTDPYQRITDQIVAMMEAGALPWSSGWQNATGGTMMQWPFNGKSGKEYNNINGLSCAYRMFENKSSDPRFFTIDALKKQTATHQKRVEKYKAEGRTNYNPELEWMYGVRKGAKGVYIQQSFPVKEDDEGNPLPQEEWHWAKSGVTVFHAADCVRRELVKDKDGNPLLTEDGKRQYKEHPLKPFKSAAKTYTHEEQYEIGDSILKASGAKIYHDVPTPVLGSPCYIKKTDEIHLPPKERFKELSEYYGTALHELGHWTGHESRLNREMPSRSQDSQGYAREELRVELASMFLATDLGIPTKPGNTAAYLQSWIKALKEDKMEIFKAQAEAKKITRYIKDFLPAKYKKKTQEEAQEAKDGVIVDATPAPSPKDEGFGKNELDYTDAILQIQQDYFQKKIDMEEGQKRFAEIQGIFDKRQGSMDSELADRVKEILDRADDLLSRAYQYEKFDLESLAMLPVRDPAFAVLPEEARANGTAEFYRYTLKRPGSPGALPTDDLYLVDNTSTKEEPYGAAYYAKPLSIEKMHEYELKPDYRYFANKAIHVKIHRKKEGHETDQKNPPRLARDFDTVYEGNFLRTNEMKLHALEHITNHFTEHPVEGKPIAPGDLIEVDGRVFEVSAQGFAQQKLNAFQNDYVLTTIQPPKVKQLLETARQMTGDNYPAYQSMLRQNFYLAAQQHMKENADRAAIGAEQDEKAIGHAYLLDYTKDFRNRTFACGLSSYTPMDKKGWEAADTMYAEQAMENPDLPKSTHMPKLEYIAKTIQQNSPYAAISQDLNYGYNIVKNANLARKAREAAQKAEAKRLKEASEMQEASRNASKAERPRPAARAR